MGANPPGPPRDSRGRFRSYDYEPGEPTARDIVIVLTNWLDGIEPAPGWQQETWQWLVDLGAEDSKYLYDEIIARITDDPVERRQLFVALVVEPVSPPEEATA